MKKSETISIHRYCEHAALAFGGINKTIYIDKDQATWLRDKLDLIVKDIETRDFVDSQFDTTAIPTHTPAPNHRTSAEGQALTEQFHGKQFTVIAVSSNANSFGLKSVLLLADDGEAWEILQSAYNGTPLPVKGSIITRKHGQFTHARYECPRQLPTLLVEKAKKILKEARTNAKKS